MYCRPVDVDDDADEFTNGYDDAGDHEQETHTHSTIHLYTVNLLEIAQKVKQT